MIEILKEAIDTMNVVLTMPSGANDFQLRTCAYYAVATWHISVLDIFPALVLFGPTGTGKTVLMKATGEFCQNPMTINAEKSTPAVIRESFADPKFVTVLIEEFNTDSPTASEIENFIIGRCGRTTGIAGKMVPALKGAWEVKNYVTYGASIIHSRDHFKDPAMENRSIVLHLQNNPNRQDYSPIPKLFVNDVVTMLRDTQSLVLPNLQPPTGIAPRVTDAYAPILRITQLINDDSYLAQLQTHLKIADAGFRDGQTFEPRALALRGLVACLTETISGVDTLRIKPVKANNIAEQLKHNYQRGLISRQICQYMRELGFTVKLSGGVNTVTNITIPQLAKACMEVGLNDELVATVAGITP
jgi:hypothetical protein